MNRIKNIHLLTDLSEKDIGMMEEAAKAHKIHGGIFFKILEYGPGQVVIRINQERHAAGNYQNSKRFNEIVHETFDRFFPGRKVVSRPIPYEQAPPSKVDSKWIQGKMLSTRTKIKDISAETGVERSQITALINGNRPLSQPMKALFYYYFEAKKQTVVSDR